MTQSIVVRSKESDAEKAGDYIADEIMKGLHGGCPDALILFASPKVDFSKLLPLLKRRCNPGAMVGCSSAGEFVSGSLGNQSVSAIAIRSEDMQFVAALGRNLKADPKHAASDIVAHFKGAENHKYAYRYALVLTDALAGYADTLVEELTRTTAGAYQLFGGGPVMMRNFSVRKCFLTPKLCRTLRSLLKSCRISPLGSASDTAGSLRVKQCV